MPTNSFLPTNLLRHERLLLLRFHSARLMRWEFATKLCIRTNSQQFMNLAFIPPQYKRFTWRKSKPVAVAEPPSIVLGIVPLCGSTVDLYLLLENALCRKCIIELKSYGTPWEVDLFWTLNFSSYPKNNAEKYAYFIRVALEWHSKCYILSNTSRNYLRVPRLKVNKTKVISGY